MMGFWSYLSLKIFKPASFFIPLQELLRGFEFGVSHLDADVVTSDGDAFGPVSQERRTDFTVLFEDSVLLVLPAALLTFIICIKYLLSIHHSRATGEIKRNSQCLNEKDRASGTHTFLSSQHPQSLQPLENRLWEFRFLWGLKILASLVSMMILLALAGLSYQISHPKLRAAGAGGFAVAAMGALLSAIVSYQTHASTWTSNVPLQCVLFGQCLVLSIRARTEWVLKTHGSRMIFVFLIASVATTFVSAILESIPRITRTRLSEERIAPELNTNLFTYSTFFFAQPFFTQAFRLYRKKEAPKGDMLWPLAVDMASEPLTHEFEIRWDLECKLAKSQNRKPRFWTLIFRIHGPNFITPSILVNVYAVAQFASPNILNGLLNWLAISRSVDGKLPPIFEGFQYALGFLAVRMINSCISSIAAYQLARELLRIRGSIIAAVYRKSLRLSPEERGSRTLGDIVSHVTVDVETITEGSWYLQVILSFFTSFALGIFFLYQQLRWAALIGLAWIITIIVGTQGFNSKAMATQFGNRMKELDKRTTLVDEAISNIKMVKLAAWEAPLLKRIRELRANEMAYLRKMAIVFGRLFVPTVLSRNGSLILMYTIYATKIAIPTANTIFVSLTVFEILYTPIEQTGFALGWLLTLHKSAARIAGFLNAEELDPDAVVISAELEGSGLAATIHEATLSWSKSSSDKKESFHLHIPHFEVKKGELLAVVGRVGCGKSSLVQALLGQMHLYNGRVELSHRSIVYCPQVPFILAGTVRDNIVGFDLQLNEPLLESVLDACALRPDLRQLPGGLDCEIGEKGVNLSGGQRSRVALARACYSAMSGQSNFLLLDSVLEAVDADTDSHLWENVIGPNGILKSFTRVIITHAVHHLRDVDNICYMAEGTIRQIGSHSKLLESDGPYLSLITDFASKERKSGGISPKGVTDSTPPSEDAIISGDLVQDESLKSGRIAGHTYLSFFRYAGWNRLLFIVFSYIFVRGTNVGSQFWLSHWVDSTDAAAGRRTEFYLGIYSMFSGVTIVLGPMNIALAGIVLIFPSTRKIYDKMIQSVLYAPMSWFNTTPTGRISNRLSSDMSQLDWDLVGGFASFLATSSTILTSLVAAAISTKGLLLTALPFLLPLYWLVFLYYTATSRSVRRLDAGITRAPIISQASETIQGATVIQAIGATGYVAAIFGKVDLNQSAKMMEYTALSWLTVRLEFMASLLVFAVSSFSVGLRTKLTPSIAGLAVSATLTLAGILTPFLDVAARMETSAVHAERCIEFAEGLPSEAPVILLEDDAQHQHWPQSGHVAFKGISARYRPELPPVLQDVSLDIPSGAKVAIVGRTGSGKSSLTLTLFRLIELSEGTIEIDGVDISKLGLWKLRKGIAIIPQENQAMAGSIRSNLSPFGEHRDEELWDALEASGLKGYVRGLDGGLDAKVQIGGSNFSTGQLQQMGLARALLTRAKILVLDEATSSLDLETDAAIQRIIRTRFEGATVLTIAHRLRTVMDYDLVLVMRDGRVGELGSPQLLLGDSGSLFHALAVEGYDEDH